MTFFSSFKNSFCCSVKNELSEIRFSLKQNPFVCARPDRIEMLLHIHPKKGENRMWVDVTHIHASRWLSSFLTYLLKHIHGNRQNSNTPNTFRLCTTAQSTTFDVPIGVFLNKQSTHTLTFGWLKKRRAKCCLFTFGLLTFDIIYRLSAVCALAVVFFRVSIYLYS